MNKKIGIIGLGLIGGSLGLSLKDKGIDVVGWDQNSIHQNRALELGLVSQLLSKEQIVKECELIIIATPTQVSIPLIKNLLDDIQEHQTVIDMGSTKSKICDALKKHPNRKNFVAAHPIAGTENSGPEAALLNLFNGKKMVICNKEESSNESLSSAIKIFNLLNCDVILMNAKEHDKHLAYISHLSHICSYALGLTVLDIEKDEQNIFNLAGSGFSSTARLAKSSPTMWESIAMQNKEHLLPAIEAYLEHLSKLKKQIEIGDSNKLIESMKKANEIRKIIKN